MAASSQCTVRFSEAWDDNDIIPPRMNISSTCEFQNASLTINLWHLDEKKIRMLKTLHADDIDVLARDRHRVNRDHGKHCNDLIGSSVESVLVPLIR
jgi:hypothetical protein